MSNFTGELSRRELFQMVLPHRALAASGSIALDRTRCTACALCAGACPAGALSEAGEEAVKLVFRPDLCDACGDCLEACPEQCLALEKNGEKAAAPLVLFEDTVVRCPACDAVSGSRAMIERVQQKLQLEDPVLVARLRLCPACRAAGQPHAGSPPVGILAGEKDGGSFA